MAEPLYGITEVWRRRLENMHRLLTSLRVTGDGVTMHRTEQSLTIHVSQKKTKNTAQAAASNLPDVLQYQILIGTADHVWGASELRLGPDPD
jgi:hypothetical protein